MVVEGKKDNFGVGQKLSEDQSFLPRLHGPVRVNQDGPRTEGAPLGPHVTIRDRVRATFVHLEKKGIRAKGGIGFP